MNETERSHTKQNRSEGERQKNTDTFPPVKIYWLHKKVGVK